MDLRVAEARVTEPRILVTKAKAKIIFNANDYLASIIMQFIVK